MHKINLRVLLIDDDEDDYLIIKELLGEIQDITYELEWAQTFTVGADRMRQERFDVYLIDFRLGQHSGLALLKEFNGDGGGLPAILLTGIGDRRIDMAALEAGAADFLVKGQFDSNLLERAIRYAIERSRLIQSLNELAMRDELTGFYNRRQLTRLLDDEVERFNRYGHPVSLIMLDIDHFKKINDQYGHPVGDQVLKQLASVIRNCVRSLDRIIRYGGEEFSIILPETFEGEAYQAAERLRKIVAENTFICTLQDGTWELISVTISLGVAELPGDGVTQDNLLAASDQALYLAKQLGRNQTVIYRNSDDKTQLLHRKKA